MSNTYVSSISYYCYSAHSDGNGTIIVQHDGNSHTFKLDEQAISELKKIADAVVKRQRNEFINKLSTLEVLPAITYEDKSEAIDHDF